MENTYKLDNSLHFSEDTEHDDSIYMSDNKAVYQLFSSGKLIQKYNIPNIKQVLALDYCVDRNDCIHHLWDDGIHSTFIYNFFDWIGPLKNIRYEDYSVDTFFINSEILYHFTINNEGEIEVKEIKSFGEEGKWVSDLDKDRTYYNLYLSYEPEEDEEEMDDDDILREYANTLVVYTPDNQNESKIIFSEEELAVLFEPVKDDELDFSIRFRESKFISGCCYSIIGNQIVCLDLTKKKVDVIYSGKSISSFLVGKDYLIIYTFESSVITVDIETKSVIHKFSLPKEFFYMHNLKWINWHTAVINTTYGLFIYDIEKKNVKNMSYLFGENDALPHFTSYDSNLAGMNITRDYTGEDLPFA